MQRTKFKLRRTKGPRLVKLSSLNPGTEFLIPDIDLHGSLEYANDCRARIRLASTRVTIGDVSFDRPRFLDICPSTLVLKQETNHGIN